MSDLISREAVEKLKKYRLSYDTNTTIPKADIFVKIADIKELPSVTSQPKIGMWIEDAKTYYEQLNERGLGVDEYTPYFTDDIACSVCLAKYSTIDNETQFFKFCPNCGADMRGEQDG